MRRDKHFPKQFLTDRTRPTNRVTRRDDAFESGLGGDPLQTWLFESVILSRLVSGWLCNGEAKQDIGDGLPGRLPSCLPGR